MKKFAAAVIAATAVIALSACGSAEIPKASGPEETAETGSLPQDVTAPIVAGVEADETIAAMLPEGMSTIKVGSNLQSPPATFLAADGSTPIGFEIDLITAMGNRLGVDLDIQNMQFDTLISGLESKRVDLTIASMNDNATRQEAIDFVNYFNSGIAILVKKGNPDGINSPEDLCGTDTYNQGLSEKRARTVFDFLTSNGVDASRLSGPVGYGESRPLEQTSQTLPGCKSETNRRTELNTQ